MWNETAFWIQPKVFFMRAALIIVSCFTAGITAIGCSTGPGIYQARLAAQADSLTAERNGLEFELAQLNAKLSTSELEWWKAMVALEAAHKALYRAKLDSVQEFYKYLLYRYRPTLEVSLDRAESSPFHYPLENGSSGGTLRVLVPWGRIFYLNDFRHLGVDLKAPEATPVRAMYDGIIRFYGAAWGYGELVVALEHSYQHNWNADVIPKKFSSIYGHLRSYEIREDPKPLRWKEGDFVKKGDIIGYVNDSDHNGHGYEHLHLGVRFQSMAEARAVDGGYWLRGYDLSSGTRLKYFYDPLLLFGRYVDIVF